MTNKYTLLSTMAAAGLALSGVAAHAASPCAPPLPTMKNGEVTYRSLAAQKAADVNEADTVLERKPPRKVSQFGIVTREVVAGSYVRAAASHATNENGTTTCVEEAEVRQQPTVTAESGLEQVGNFFSSLGNAAAGAGQAMYGGAAFRGKLQPVDNSVQNTTVQGSSATVGNVSAAGGAGGSSISTANATGGSAVAKGGTAISKSDSAATLKNTTSVDVSVKQSQQNDQNQYQDQNQGQSQRQQGYGKKKQECHTCG